MLVLSFMVLNEVCEFKVLRTYGFLVEYVVAALKYEIPFAKTIGYQVK